MRRVVSLKSALALAILVGLLAFLAGSYSTPTPATAQEEAQAALALDDRGP